MSNNLQAKFTGKLKIGDLELPCFVLSDDKRVISGRGVTSAIGMKGRGQGIDRIMHNPSIKPFISEDLDLAIKNPIRFKAGGFDTYGYEASSLHMLCEAILQARASGKIRTKAGMRYAATAEILVRAFAKVGIVALIDEATGYQNVRNRNELEQLLAVYLAEERLAWAKKFPDVFYKEIYRLNNWVWPAENTAKRPSIIGRYTNDIVYERLPYGVLEKLREMNPVAAATKRRKYKHHQFLSKDIGQPDLHNHLLQIIALMKASTSWNEFIKLLDRAIPKTSSTSQTNPEALNE